MEEAGVIGVFVGYEAARGNGWSGLYLARALEDLAGVVLHAS